jgi:hypothetical protein
MVNVKKMLVLLALGLFSSTVFLNAKTAGTVNGMKITVKDANKALKLLTKGKQTWATLPKEGKKQLIYMLAPSKVVAATAKRHLTKKEKEGAIANYWMQKKMSKINISDSEAKTAYNKMLKMAKKAKSKAKIPPFKQAKNGLKMQLAQEKIVSSLMKKAKIKIK